MFSQELRCRVAMAVNKRLTLLGTVTTAVAQHLSQPPKKTTLEEVAHFDHEVTGVAVSTEDRIFVNSPRWTEVSAISVAEVGRDGKLTPYPDAERNAWWNDGEFQMPCSRANRT